MSEFEKTHADSQTLAYTWSIYDKSFLYVVI